MADIATLELRVKALEVDQATKKVDRLEKASGKAEKRAGTMGRAFKTAGVTIAAAWITRQMIRNTIDAQNAMAQLEAVVRSTGGAAGRSVADLDRMANALQEVTNYSDEATKGAQALLLTFTKIRGPEFDRATVAVLDMSTALGTDLKSSAILVGKALNDPILGISALGRSGIQFSEAQKAVIKELAETNRMAEAQGLILEELETQFSGSAAAARNTLGGALQYVKNQWADSLEVSRDSSQGMIDSLEALGDAIPKVREGFVSLFIAIQILAAEAAVGVARLELEIRKLQDSTLGGILGLGEGAGLFDPLGLDPILRAADAIGVDLRGSVEDAEANLRRMEQAAADVIAGLFDVVAAVDDIAAAERAAAAATADAAEAATKAAAEKLAAAKATTTAIWDEVEALRAEREALQQSRDAETQRRAGVGNRNMAHLIAQEAERWRMASGKAVDGTNAVVGVLEDFAGGLRDVVSDVLGALSDLLQGIEDEDQRSRLQGLLGAAGLAYGIGRQLGGTTTNKWAGAAMGAGGGAAAGFAVAGPVGAVVGGISGAIGGWLSASKKAKEAAEEAFRIESELFRQREAEAARAKGLVRSTEDYVASLDAREKMLHATDDNERTRIQAAITRDQKLMDTARMLEDGLISERDAVRANALAHGEYTAEIRALGEAMAEAAKRAAEFTAQLIADLTARGYAATGNSRAAEDIRREFGYAQERSSAASQSPAVRALLELVQGAERSEIMFGRRMEDLQQSMADALSSYDQQITVAENQLRVAENSLRAQEQTVAATRQVVDSLTDFSRSLVLGSASPLSPFAQLQEARSQFDAMAALAMTGDLSAAQSLPGAAQALLGASRGYSASGAGYVADFQSVQAVIAEVTARFGVQLSVEERMLRELERQSSSLQKQVNELVAERASAAQRYTDQIAKLQAEWEKERERWRDLLAYQFQQVHLQDRLVTTDPGDSIVDITPVLQTGFSELSDRLVAVETAVGEVTSQVRRSFEALGDREF